MLKRFIFGGLFVVIFLTACSNSGTSAPTPTLTEQEALGKTAFSTYCATCHSIDPGTIIVGPSLFGIASSAGERIEGTDDKTYLSLSIMQPDNYLVEGFDDSMPNDPQNGRDRALARGQDRPH